MGLYFDMRPLKCNENLTRAQLDEKLRAALTELEVENGGYHYPDPPAPERGVRHVHCTKHYPDGSRKEWTEIHKPDPDPIRYEVSSKSWGGQLNLASAEKFGPSYWGWVRASWATTAEGFEFLTMLGARAGFAFCDNHGPIDGRYPSPSTNLGAQLLGVVRG
ncbi:MAG: hypothetical protein ACT4PZ_19760 [Panacagrimonas sp.]